MGMSMRIDRNFGGTGRPAARASPGVPAGQTINYHLHAHVRTNNQPQIA